MKDQWKQGLQWGGVVWLAWISATSIGSILRFAHHGVSLQMVLPAIGWALALALQWTRLSRLGIVLGIAAQVYAGVVLGEPIIARADYQMGDVMTESYLDLEPLLKSFLPACLPILPLLFMSPTRPRYVAALALVGRWHDTAREMTGLRWVLVAAGVLALPCIVPDALRWWAFDDNGHVYFDVVRFAAKLSPSLVLLGLAAVRVPRVRVSG